jgi:hypothetical protein
MNKNRQVSVRPSVLLPFRAISLTHTTTKNFSNRWQRTVPLDIDRLGPTYTSGRQVGRVASQPLSCYRRPIIKPTMCAPRSICHGKGVWVCVCARVCCVWFCVYVCHHSIWQTNLCMMDRASSKNSLFLVKCPLCKHKAFRNSPSLLLQPINQPTPQPNRCVRVLVNTRGLWVSLNKGKKVEKPAPTRCSFIGRLFI